MRLRIWKVLTLLRQIRYGSAHRRDHNLEHTDAHRWTLPLLQARYLSNSYWFFDLRIHSCVNQILMTGKTKPMNQIKQFLQLRKQRESKKSIVGFLGDTVKIYLAKLSGVDIDALLSLGIPPWNYRFTFS